MQELTDYLSYKEANAKSEAPQVGVDQLARENCP